MFKDYTNTHTYREAFKNKKIEKNETMTKTNLRIFTSSLFCFQSFSLAIVFNCVCILFMSVFLIHEMNDAPTTCVYSIHTILHDHHSIGILTKFLLYKFFLEWIQEEIGKNFLQISLRSYATKPMLTSKNLKWNHFFGFSSNW